MIISKSLHNDFRGGILDQIKSFRLSSPLNYYFSDKADVAGNLFRSERVIVA
jgi:hypothetical protein